MNTVESCQIISPFDKTEECAKLTIIDTTKQFVMKATTKASQQYTFSFYAKSDATGSIRAGGNTFAISAEWAKYAVTFTAASEDFALTFNAAGTYYIYHPQLELGNKATDWTPAPEDMATAEALLKAETRITQTENSIALQATKMDALGNRTSVLEQTATAFELRFKTVETDVNNTQKTANGAQVAANNAKTTAEEAAKTATNFLSFTEEEGLQVGNKTSGEWVGTRTQQTADAFKILDANGAELATYGADLVELGKKSDDAVISFCNGRARMSADKNDGLFRLYADNFAAGSSKNLPESLVGDMKLRSYFSARAVKRYWSDLLRADANEYVSYSELSNMADVLQDSTQKAEMSLSAGAYNSFLINDPMVSPAPISVRRGSEARIKIYAELDDSGIRIDAGNIYFNGVALGAKQIANLGDGTILGVLSMMPSISLLWENPAPASNFAAQAITVPDMTQFQFIAIEYRLNTGNAWNMTQIAKSGETINLMIAGKSGYGKRTATYTDANTFTFTHGSWNGNDGTSYNNYEIPIRIYGIKMGIIDLTSS